MSPAISVVVPAETADSIRPLLSHLRRQTVAERIELIVVAPSGAPLELEESATAAFAAARTLTIPAAELTDLPLARAAGVRSAAAPIVAFTETHCFAEPGWAEALIAAHEGPWAAVGPAFVNGNPGTAVSWSNLLIDYGPWIEPVKAGPVRDLPGHNSSYDTAELRAYGERLEAMLAAEFVMHDEMRSRGRALYLEPAARTRHHNVTRLGSWLPERFHAGRAFAAQLRVHILTCCRSRVDVMWTIEVGVTLCGPLARTPRPDLVTPRTAIFTPPTTPRGRASRLQPQHPGTATPPVLGFTDTSTAPR